MTLPPDTNLNERYRISYLADERPYSPIYRAYDTQAGRRVLLCAFGEESYHAEEVAHLAEQLLTLDTPGMLPLLDHFPGQGAYYLVAEDPGGQDLDRLIREQGGPMAESHMLEQARTLLVVLDKAHEQRPPLHIGDLRSADIWATPNRELRLTPFAFVSQVGSGPTPYRAPELLQEDGEPNPTSDLYALGAVLYQLATGWSPPNVQQRVAGTPLVAPRQLNPQLSALADQAISRALELRTANRYHVAREMHRSIEMVQLMGGRSLGGGPDVSGLVDKAPPQMPAVAPNVPSMPPPAAGTVLPGNPPPGSPPVYGASPAYAGAYAAGTPYPPQAPPAHRGISGCWIAAIVAFLVMVGSFCLLALVLVFGPGRPIFERILSGAGAIVSPTSVAGPTPAPAAAAPTAVPNIAPVPTEPPSAALPALGPRAISLVNVDQITETSEFTSTTLGPGAFSPDGDLVAVALDNRVLINRAASFETISQIESPGTTVGAIAWSADSARIAVAGLGSADVRIYDVRSGREAQVLSGHSSYLRSLAWSPDGAIIASGSADRTIRLWDAVSGTLLRTLEGHSDLIGAIAFSPDSTTLASASRDGSVRLWDVASGQSRSDWTYNTPLDPNSGRPYWTTGVVFSPDGKLLAAGAIDGIVRVWELPNDEPKYELKGHTNWVVIRGLAFSPDSKTLASGSRDRTIRLWSMDSGSERAVLEGHHLQVISIAWSPDGDRLLSTSDEDGQLLFWDTTSASLSQTYQLGNGLVTALAFSPDNTMLGRTSISGMAILNDLASGRARSLQGTLPVEQGLAFLPNSRMVALSDRGDVVIWDLQSGRQQGALDGLSEQARSVAVSGDGKLIGAGDAGGGVTIWDAESGRRLQQLSGLDGNVFNLSFSSDGAFVAAYSDAADSVLSVWDIASGSLVQSIERPAPLTAIAFVPASYKLAVADRSGGLTFYDARQSTQLFMIEPPAPQIWFTTLAFNPDGTLASAGAVDGGIYIYSTAESRLVLLFDASADGILALAFRPDGEQLAFSGRDGSVRVLGIE